MDFSLVLPFFSLFFFFIWRIDCVFYRLVIFDSFPSRLLKKISVLTLFFSSYELVLYCSINTEELPGHRENPHVVGSENSNARRLSRIMSNSVGQSRRFTLSVLSAGVLVLPLAKTRTFVRPRTHAHTNTRNDCARKDKNFDFVAVSHN